MGPSQNRTEQEPAEPAAGDITLLLQRCQHGEKQAFADIFERLYPELRKLAASKMKLERPDHTWQPTALLNEFFLRMARQTDLSWKNRAHFFAVASRAMRNLLVDHARMRAAQKGPGSYEFVEVRDLAAPGHSGAITVLEFVDLLERLEAEEPRMAQVAELRCFGGLTHEEIAEALGISDRTVKRDWDVAEAWLRSQLKKGSGNVTRRVGPD